MAASERTGLYEMIAQARECWVGRVLLDEGVVRDAWFIEETVRQAVDQVVLDAWLGSFMGPGLPEHIWSELSECPGWTAFCEVCDLVGRIDSLLITLESNNRALARACREDLDALPVLADWYEESGRHASAAELRHLHGLVRHFRASFTTSPMPLVLSVEPGDEADLE
jgi:hypothetical protein